MRDQLPLQFLQPALSASDRPQIASLWERANGDSLLGSFYSVSAECRMAMTAWAEIEISVERAYGTAFSVEKVAALEFKRLMHQRRYPFLLKLQELARETRNDDPDRILDWLPYLPYARFNVEAYLKTRMMSWNEFMLAGELQDGRASLLSLEERDELDVPNFTYGLCFKRAEGTHIVLRAECSSLVQALNLGYELIYLHEMETRADVIRVGTQSTCELVPSIENQKNLRYLEALGIQLPFDPENWIRRELTT